MDLNITATLAKVLQAYDTPSSFLIDKFFAQKYFSEDEFIHFDDLPGDIDLAPYVAPTMPALAGTIDDGEVRLFKPAYVKPMHTLKNGAALARALGEAIGGSSSANVRYVNTMVQTLEKQRHQIIRRKEFMAAEVLQTGKAVISGPNYPERTVDFGRAADQTIVLTGADRWGQVGVHVLDDIEAWGERASAASGIPVNTVIFGSGAWKTARKDEKFLELLDIRRQASGSVELGPVSVGSEKQKARYLGTVGDFDFYLYVELYKDATGVKKSMIDPFNVVLTATGMDGIQAHGAIENPDFGFQALEFAPNIVSEQNPRVDSLITESSPLIIPGQPDATFCATVHTDE